MEITVFVVVELKSLWCQMTPFAHLPAESGTTLCLHVSFQFWTVCVKQGLRHIPIRCHISHPSSQWTAGSFFKGEMQFNKVEENITLLFLYTYTGRRKKSLPKELPSIKEEGREALDAKRKRKISLARQTDIASTCSSQETRSSPTQLFETGSNLRGAPVMWLCALLPRAGDRRSLKGFLRPKENNHCKEGPEFSVPILYTGLDSMFCYCLIYFSS